MESRREARQGNDKPSLSAAHSAVGADPLRTVRLPMLTQGGGGPGA